VEIQIVVLVLWKCLLRRRPKIVAKDSQSKTSTTGAMENVEGLCSTPSVNTAIPSAFQFEMQVLIFFFS
jgi:hypothetical protein